VENSSPTIDDVNLSVRFDAGTDNDGVRAIVYSPAGRVKLSQTAYITVADGRYVEGQWIMHKASRLSNGTVSQEIGPATQITVKINRYTAHTSYHTPSDYLPGYFVQ